MRNIVFVFTLAVLASACGAPSVEDLANNPKKLARVAEECAKEHPFGTDLSEKCLNAQKALVRQTEKMVDDMLN